MKVRVFRETETMEVRGSSLHEAYCPPLPLGCFGPEVNPFPPPLDIEHREYPIRVMVRAKEGLVTERHNIVFADPLVNELLDAQQWEAAFWRDAVRNRAKESELLGKELKEASRREGWYRTWAWIWAGTATGLLIALGLVVFL